MVLLVRLAHGCDVLMTCNETLCVDPLSVHPRPEVLTRPILVPLNDVLQVQPESEVARSVANLEALLSRDA